LFSMNIFKHPSLSSLIGVARRDITPPIGIYARNWGAAEHEVAEGVHRPLTATALVVRAAPTPDPSPANRNSLHSFMAAAERGGQAPLSRSDGGGVGGGGLTLVSLDLGWWRTPEDEWALRGALIRDCQLDPAHVLVHLTHTHAGPALCREDAGKPGGHLIAAYLDGVTQSVIDVVREAATNAQPATLEWTYGQCMLAQNRDLPDQENPSRMVCGWNPANPADDTLLVGRATNEVGQVIATLVNYACHPTTLAWQNKLISPDFVGAMRETVEANGGGLCLFLQGASGELSPIEQYTGDIAIADKHGRTLGYAVLGTLAGMLPPRMQLRYSGVVESGAPLAVWAREPAQASTALKALQATAGTELKRDLPSLAEIESDLSAAIAEATDAFLIERLRRKTRVRRAVGDAAHTNAAHTNAPRTPLPVWVWQLGDCVVVAQANEAYSNLQTELRARFPDKAIVVMNITNGPHCGYLPPRALYSKDLYQVWQSPFAAGCLEQMIETCADAISELQ
jgi:hypothetical protein